MRTGRVWVTLSIAFLAALACTPSPTPLFYLPILLSICFVRLARWGLDLLCDKYGRLPTQGIQKQVALMASMQRVRRLARKVSDASSDLTPSSSHPSQKNSPEQVAHQKVAEVMVEIRRKCRQLHSRQPVKIYSYKQEGDINRGIKQQFQDTRRMMDNTRKELTLNCQIGVPFVLQARLVLLLKQIHGKWMELGQAVNEGSRISQSLKKGLTDEQRILVDAINLAISSHETQNSKGAASVSTALAYIDKFLNSKEEQPSPTPFPVKQVAEFVINDPHPDPPIQKVEGSKQENEYNREKFKSQLDRLLVRGWQEREQKAIEEAQRTQETMEALQPLAVYSADRREYAVEGDPEDAVKT